MGAEIGASARAPLTESAAEVARRLARRPLRPASVAATAFALDAAAAALGLWTAHGLAPGAGPGPLAAALAAAGAGLLAATAILAARGYRLTALRRFWRGWATAAAAAALAAGAGLALGAWGFWPALLAPALLALPARALSSRIAGCVLDFGLTERRAVIVGGGAEAARLIRGLARNPDCDIRVCGLFDDREDARSPPVVVGTPKLGGVREAVAFVRAAEIDMLIIALPLTAERRIRDILAEVRVLPVDVRLSSFSADFAFPRRGEAAALVEVARRPLAGWRWLAKRAIDLAGATALLALLAPVLLATAAAIGIETPGSVFFRQQRHGYNNRPFWVWKFRSMHAAQSDPTARRPVARDDPRVTRVGRFIRRWSIDELPQLVNVLRGELSLVGPRPHALDAVSSEARAFEEIVEGYAARHRVPPGLTGWAQIHGWRGAIDDPEKLRMRVAHDLHYIENWSVWLDLRILAATPLRLLDAKNAF